MEQRGPAPAVLVTTRYRARPCSGPGPQRPRGAARPGSGGTGEGKGKERKERGAAEAEGKESRVVLPRFAPGHFSCSPVFLISQPGQIPGPCSVPFPLVITPAVRPPLWSSVCCRPPGTAFPCRCLEVGGRELGFIPGCAAAPWRRGVPGALAGAIPAAVPRILLCPLRLGGQGWAKRLYSPFSPSRSYEAIYPLRGARVAVF